jgi:hypothetical protein
MAFVKLIETDPGRPNGRLRVRVLNDRTNELVTYPGGRTRYFGSEEDADAWIAAAREREPEPATLRRWQP